MDGQLETMIKDLLKVESNTLLVINADDLKVYSENLINETMAKLSSKEEDVFLTAVEASEKLKVNRVTLWSWEKKGYLKPTRIGAKVRYKLSDINRLLNGED
jgi:predicted DNA-binding transcriptional regulator AlpA